MLVFTRSTLPAPQFWPTNVVTDTLNAPITIQIMLSTLPNAVHAAIVSVPRAFMFA